MFKGRQFDRSVILLCVRWYLAYSLSLRDLEEMMAERGISVDHATVGRWVVRYSPPSFSSVSINANGPSGGNGMWMRRISRYVVSGDICTAPLTATAIRSRSGSAKNVTLPPPNGFCERLSGDTADPRGS